MRAGADHSEEDVEGDGELGANQSLEQIRIAEGIAEDRREQEDPACQLLAATRDVPDKAMLDTNVNRQCNDPLNNVPGQCNCPNNGRCTVSGTTASTQTWFCS